MTIQPFNDCFSVDCVKWFRDCAACQRSREEKEILEEEFKRTIRSFEHYEEVWKELSQKGCSQSGQAVYTFQTAAMFAQLAADCKEAFRRATLKT